MDKKQMLITMIDDMASALMDRSSLGYSRYLESRAKLIELIESLVEDDKSKHSIMAAIIGNVDKYLESDVALANKLRQNHMGMDVGY